MLEVPVLIVGGGPRGEAWRDTASRVATSVRPELTAHVIGGADIADPEGGWPTAYGVEMDSAVLVRPDGYVCWGSATSAAEPLLCWRKSSTACSATR